MTDEEKKNMGGTGTDTQSKSSEATSTSTGHEVVRPATPVFDGGKWDEEYGKGYDEILEQIRSAMAANPVESEAERKARERRERTQGIVNGIAEMATAIGNLYHTTKGAPNMYDPKHTFSNAYEARMEKARAARKEREGLHEKYMQRLQGLQTARAEAKRKAKADADNSAYRQGMLDAKWEDLTRKQQELDFKQEMAELKRLAEERKIGVAELNARTREMATKYNMSRANINHNLASYTEITEDIYDDRHRKIGTKKRRLVVNPESGDLEEEKPTEQDKGKGGGASGGQQKKKSSGVNYGSANTSGKKSSGVKF